jgi:Protein of unknown function (DUF2586)
MGIPNVSLTILDNQLGQTSLTTGNIEVVIGVCSGGTQSNFQPYTTSSLATIKANSGVGPAPRLAAFTAAQSGQPVTVCTIPQAANGTLTSTFAGANNSGSSTSVPVFSGNPNDDYFLVLQNLNTFTVGTTGGQIAISIDGGATFAYTINLGTATTVTTGSAFTTYTGLTLTLGVGAMTANDTWFAVAVAPTWTDAAVQSALNAVAAQKFQTFQDVAVAGVSAASDVTAFDGYMTTLANTNKRFSRLLCSAQDATWGGASTQTESQWINTLTGNFATTSSLRVGVCAGYYRFIDPFTQSQMRSSILYGAMGRDAQVLGSVDLGEVDMGSLQSLVLPTKTDTFANGSFFYHDEDQNPGLDSARFLTGRQFVGLTGIFITNPNLIAPPGSDFNWLQHGHVIDEASYVVYQFFTLNLSRPVRVSPKTGFILPQEQKRLQNGCQSQLNNVLGNQVSGLIVQVSPSDNILSTSTITVFIYVIPLAYIKSVNANIALFNPANTQTFNAIGVAA